MALSPINPTQLTPPRVALIDDRSGAISREWYRFFLSLLTATQTNQAETELAPDTSSLLASYDAMLAELAQTTETQPEGASVAALAVVQSETQALAVTPPGASVSALAVVQSETQALAVTPPGASMSALAIVQSDLQALALAPPPKQARTPRYGSFYDTTTQTAAAINVAYPMTFNTTDLSFGVTRGSPTSRIFVDRPNIYNVQFSAQLDKTAGGVALVWVWLRKNGTNVPDSAGQIRIQGNNAETLAAWNYIIQLNAGDYIELMWEVSDTSVELLAEVASAVHPSIPSVILTVTDNISSMET
jgi:hypothetical protein